MYRVIASGEDGLPDWERDDIATQPVALALAVELAAQYVRVQVLDGAKVVLRYDVDGFDL